MTEIVSWLLRWLSWGRHVGLLDRRGSHCEASWALLQAWPYAVTGMPSAPPNSHQEGGLAAQGRLRHQIYSVHTLKSQVGVRPSSTYKDAAE